MKSYYYIFLTLCLLLVSSNFAVAQTTTSETLEEDSSEQATTTEKKPDSVREITPERQVALSAQTQKRITNLAANLSNRFDVVIERLFNVMNRMESRLNKLEENGQDVGQARNYLVTARDSLNRAKANMSNIDSQVSMMVGSTNPREEWRSLKSTYSSTRELVRSAHADMRAAILSLKTTPPENPSN